MFFKRRPPEAAAEETDYMKTTRKRPKVTPKAKSPKAKGRPSKVKSRGNGRRAPRSLGSVSNLEEHVRPDWWRRIFNSLYVKTDGDVVEDDSITRSEASIFSEILQLSPEHRILDLCCGQGRHALELARRGFENVEGLDRSRYLVQKARARAAREGLGARFREGDARKLPYEPDTFDAVLILGNSFGYFDSVEEDMRVLKGVLGALKPWGKLLIDATDGEYLRDHFQSRSWEWIDKRLFVCRERSLSLDGHRLISREVVTHVERGVVADQFYAERLYSQKDLIALLRKAGFSNIAVHGSFSPESQRNQDLGMMEKRIIVTAVAKKEWTPVKRRPRAVRNVVVLLGDPSKADPLKPLCVFDDDDYYTIDQMKSALKGLKDHHFKYLTGHDTLIHDLMSAKSKVDLVLNLCDEGYGNNPRHELHVPAILEMLGVPYTGAGPQCLGMCYDKSIVRGVATEMGIPVPEAFFVKSEDNILEMTFGFPAIVKPNFGDSSFGITQRSICVNVEQIVNAVNEIRGKFGYDKPILVEEFLTGKDLSVGIIGNPPDSYRVLPIIEEDYSALPPELPKVCGYEAKWLPDSPYWNIKSIPAELPEATEKLMVECCLKLFTRLECRDYCRFDWRLDAKGNPKLLEVNPNPGWCWDGHLAKMAKIVGISYREMLAAILEAAEVRLGLKTVPQEG